MASILSFTISLLLCTLLLAVPISAHPLDSICKQTQSPSLCYNLLKPHANASLQELDQFVIDATTSSAKDISSKILSLRLKNNDPNLKVVYSLCANYYSAALDVLSAANEKLRSRDYSGVKSAAAAVASDAKACREAFAFAPSKPIVIAGDNTQFENLSNVFVVVSGKL